MTSYKELGLVNSRELFQKAMAGKYANQTLLRYMTQGCCFFRTNSF
jgi:hypothetical protein